VTGERLLAAWDRFWHTPADPRIAAGFRIVFGIIVALMFLGQLPFVELWWGDQGLCPPQLGRKMRADSSWSLLFMLPSGYLHVYLGLAVGHALLISAGVFHRVNAAMLFVWLVSFQNRCTFINDGEDTMVRLFCFFLIFLDANRVWALVPRKPDAPTHSGFALRLIQLQTVFTFGVAGMEKWPGPAWWNGEAMFHVLHLDDYTDRMPFMAPLIEAAPWLSWPMSTGTLFLEFVIPIIVWVPRLRIVAVAMAVTWHIILESMAFLYAFEFLMMLGWLSFLTWPGHRRSLDEPSTEPPAADAA